MNFRLLPLAIIALLILGTGNIFAQGEGEADPLNPRQLTTPVYIGPVIGFNRAIHTAELATFSNDVLCPYFENGTANGFFGGLSFEYFFGNPGNSTSSIIVRGLYNTLPASFSREGDKYPSLVEDPASQTGYTTVLSVTEHTVEVSYSVLTFEVMYKLNLFNTPIAISAGPTFDFPMTKTKEQLYKIKEPNNIQFKRNEEQIQNGEIEGYTDNDRTIIVESGDIPGAASFRLGLKFGIMYEINLKKLLVVPSIHYNYGLTKLTDTENWNVHALQIGIDVRYAFTF